MQRILQFVHRRRSALPPRHHVVDLQPHRRAADSAIHERHWHFPLVPLHAPPASPWDGTLARRFSCCSPSAVRGAARRSPARPSPSACTWDWPALALLSLARNSLDTVDVHAALRWRSSARRRSSTIPRRARRFPHRFRPALPKIRPGESPKQLISLERGIWVDHRPSRDHRRRQDLRRDLPSPPAWSSGRTSAGPRHGSPRSCTFASCSDAGQAEPAVSQRLHHLREPLDEPRRDLPVVGRAARESSSSRTEVVEDVRVAESPVRARPVELRRGRPGSRPRAPCSRRSRSARWREDSRAADRFVSFMPPLSHANFGPRQTHQDGRWSDIPRGDLEPRQTRRRPADEAPASRQGRFLRGSLAEAGSVRKALSRLLSSERPICPMVRAADGAVASRAASRSGGSGEFRPDATRRRRRRIAPPRFAVERDHAPQGEPRRGGPRAPPRELEGAPPGAAPPHPRRRPQRRQPCAS